jgi:uncharacterized protein
MRTVFADSFYLIALLNEDDAANARAVQFTKEYVGQYLTTRAILLELADALAGPRSRLPAGRFIDALPANKAIRVHEVGGDLFQAGLDLYLKRPDKQWSLTDCISFALMTREGITDALTGDHHFEQAGFVALLK